MCMRSGAGIEHDTVGNLTSAQDSETEQAGEEPQGRKIHILFPGRRSCTCNHCTGQRTHRRIDKREEQCCCSSF